MAQSNRMRFATAQAAADSINRHHHPEQCAIALEMVRAAGSWNVSDWCAMAAMMLASALSLAQSDDREVMENAVGLMARQILAASPQPVIGDTKGQA